jgi:hypothetical protein
MEAMIAMKAGEKELEMRMKGLGRAERQAAELEDAQAGA